MPNSGPGGTPQLKVPPKITRAQPTVTPSVSNPNPVKHVSHQFDPFGGIISGAKRLGSSIAHGASGALHSAEDFWLGDAKERQAAQKIVHDKLSTQTPQRVLLKKGWDSKAHFDKDGNPVGNWKYNQDNSGGPNANWHENDNGRDEQGNAYDPNDVIHYKGGTWLRHDFGTGTQSDEPDWIAGNTHHPGIYGYTNPQTGANIHFQLGTQAAVGGSGSAYGAGLTGIQNGAAISGRASGALTQGPWTQGAASGNYSGGPSGTSNFVNNGGGASSSGSSIVQWNPFKPKP